MRCTEGKRAMVKPFLSSLLPGASTLRHKSFVFIPTPPKLIDQLNTTLITSILESSVSDLSGQALVSSILNITLLDGQANSISQLDSPLTICLVLNGTKSSAGVCLSYFNERKSKWMCEDKCLTSVTAKGSSKEGENLVCGQTVTPSHELRSSFDRKRW